MGVIEFAESEWKKYLALAGVDGRITGSVKNVFDKSRFRINNAEYDPKFDDAFIVEIKNGTGSIVATNERSVLLGVYESLRRLGYLFCFPGKKGEFVPKGLKAEDVNLKFTHYAEYRYRGVALCGPKELYSVLDYIDWMPKVGLNTYFREFWSDHLAWRSWYLKEENPYLKKDLSYTLEKGLEYDKLTEKRAKERGLLFHAVGHGWNVAVIGKDVYNDFLPTAETEIDYDKVALVNGKRSLPHGIIRCANLCVSKSEVRKKFISLLLSYVKEHPKTDVLHVYLGDSLNNACECENCKKHTLSEWLCILLNEIDTALNAIKSDIKVVFGVYNDTLWNPKTVKINGNRFILQFCPISRDYSRSFSGLRPTAEKDLPAYSLNKVQAPVKEEDFYGYLKGWQNRFGGESVCFDYHGYYAVRYDLSQITAAKVAVKDVKYYKEMGFNGLISCQFYRNAFPHGYLCYATARALFDGEFNAQAEEKTYFNACFGKAAGVASEYFLLVNKALPIRLLQWYGETDEIRREYGKPVADANLLTELKIATAETAKKISGKGESELQKTCIKTFGYYLAAIDAVCDLVRIKAEKGGADRLKDRISALKEILCKNENYLLPYCSIDHLLQTLCWFADKS